ncbi:hypothetical protein ACFX2J_004084 [Malus domestica]
MAEVDDVEDSGDFKIVTAIKAQVVLSNGITTTESPPAQIPFDPFGSFNVSNGSAPTRPETEPIRDIPGPFDQHQVRSKLVDCDGGDVAHYSPNCTHVIVDKIVYDDPICVAARNDAKTLVTALWVHHSFDVGLPIDPTCRACPPTLSKPNPRFSSTCSPISPRPKSCASTSGTKSSTAPTPSCLFSAMVSEGQSPLMSWRDSYKGMSSDNIKDCAGALDVTDDLQHLLDRDELTGLHCFHHLRDRVAASIESINSILST